MLLSESDCISVHVPLSPETRHLSEAEMARMKHGAIIVKSSRGSVLDEAALIDALREGRLGGAGLDVFETEPLLGRRARSGNSTMSFSRSRGLVQRGIAHGAEVESREEMLPPC